MSMDSTRGRRRRTQAVDFDHEDDEGDFEQTFETRHSPEPSFSHNDSDNEQQFRFSDDYRKVEEGFGRPTAGSQIGPIDSSRYLDGADDSDTIDQTAPLSAYGAESDDDNEFLPSPVLTYTALKPLRAGTMQKKGGSGYFYTPRWCIVYPGFLCWYEEEPKSNAITRPKGVLHLPLFHVGHRTRRRDEKFDITFIPIKFPKKSKYRSYRDLQPCRFRCKNREQMLKWIHAIRIAQNSSESQGGIQLEFDGRREVYDRNRIVDLLREIETLKETAEQDRIAAQRQREQHAELVEEYENKLADKDKAYNELSLNKQDQFRANQEAELLHSDQVRGYKKTSKKLAIEVKSLREELKTAKTNASKFKESLDDFHGKDDELREFLNRTRRIFEKLTRFSFENIMNNDPNLNNDQLYDECQERCMMSLEEIRRIKSRDHSPLVVSSIELFKEIMRSFVKKTLEHAVLVQVHESLQKENQELRDVRERQDEEVEDLTNLVYANVAPM